MRHLKRLVAILALAAVSHGCRTPDSRRTSTLHDQATAGVSGCNATQAATLTQSVQDALAILDAEGCQNALDDQWSSQLKARLQGRSTIACSSSSTGRGGEFAVHSQGQIIVRPIFFTLSPASQADTLFHEASHAIGVRVGTDHNSASHTVPSSGDLRDVFWLRDPIYFCTKYCASFPSDPRETFATYVDSLNAQSAADKATRTRLVQALASYDLLAHATSMCRKQRTPSFFGL